MTTLIARNETNIDKEWINQAIKYRIAVKIFEFNKINNTVFIRSLKGPKNLETIEQKFINDEECKTAIIRAARHLNSTTINYEILKKYYLMLKHTSSLYFVGKFSNDKRRLQIDGDEGWFVEMFFDLLKSKSYLLPIYMYNTLFKNWCQLNKDYKWIRIARPPRPLGNFIGIGCNYDEINHEIQLIF